jgi:hypothetical protein
VAASAGSTPPTLCVDPPYECAPIDVVDEGALAVDLDDRQPFAVPGLELGPAADVDLVELELVLAPHLCEGSPRTLAEMAVVRVEERYANGYGYRPRVVVASATRWTARP